MAFKKTCFYMALGQKKFQKISPGMKVGPNFFNDVTGVQDHKRKTEKRQKSCLCRKTSLE
jgi:hypothetical protein